MTSAEAISVLHQSEGQGYIAWDSERGIPDVRNGTVVLDGSFSEQELCAILAFFRTPRGQDE